MMSTSFPSRARTNTTDVVEAISAGCVPMERMYDPQRRGLPYFGNQVVGPVPGSSHFENYSIAHMPGRWLNALLSAENAIDREADPEAIRHLTQWTYSAFGGGFALAKFIDTDTLEVQPRADLHNLREGMHALWALTEFRSDARAQSLAEANVATISQHFDDTTGTWDEDKFRATFNGETTFTCGRVFTFPLAFGRFLGPLVKYYRTSGSDSARALADRIAFFALENLVTSSGEHDVATFGEHVHSTTAMLSSLAQYAEATHDERALDHLEAFVGNGLNEISLNFGWCMENFYQETMWGEGNNTIDLIELFLILGKNRDPRYYRRAERALRSHLLPSQLIDSSFIDDSPARDFGSNQLATQVRGAFGFPTPWGHEQEPGAIISYNWDIVGGVVGGLTEVTRHIVNHEGGTTTVAMHFPIHDRVIVASGITSPGANPTIRVHEARTLRVLLPEWVDATRVVSRLASRGLAARCDDPWLIFDADPSYGDIELDFSVESAVEFASFRDVELAFRRHGDFITAMSAPDKRLRFFDDL